MIKADAVIEKEKGKSLEEIEKKYDKCTVCGLYGEKKEIISDTIINDNIYVNICDNCVSYLETGGKIKKRKYFSEEIEDYID